MINFEKELWLHNISNINDHKILIKLILIKHWMSGLNIIENFKFSNSLHLIKVCVPLKDEDIERKIQILSFNKNNLLHHN